MGIPCSLSCLTPEISNISLKVPILNNEQRTMNNRYSFIKFTYFILQILKVRNINCSKSYVGRGLNTSQDHKINR